MLPGHLAGGCTMPSTYAGTLLLAGSATSLIIFASLGGISWGWTSVPSVASAVLGVVLAVVFVQANTAPPSPSSRSSR